MGSITIRIDDETKAQAEAELAQLGVSHTEVITGVYRYIIRYHRLPFSEDDTALALMKTRLAELAPLADALNSSLQQNGYISTSGRDAVVTLLNRFGTDLDANYAGMKRASNNFLHPAWTDAMQAAKGLSYMLTLTARKQGRPGQLTFDDTREISKVVGHLISNNEFINGDKA